MILSIKMAFITCMCAGMGYTAQWDSLSGELYLTVSALGHALGIA